MLRRRLKALALSGFLAASVHAPTAGAAALPQGYASAEIVAAGHRVFGNVAGDFATIVERLVARYGLPSGYIVGEEASGAVMGGLRYGEGTLYTRAGSRQTAARTDALCEMPDLRIDWERVRVDADKLLAALCWPSTGG